MERVKVNKIEHIDERDLSIFLDCLIQGGSNQNDQSIPLNDVDVIISVFDSVNNFIMQKKVAGKYFRYNFRSESELMEYIYNEILNIDDSDDLNPGLYKLKFSFILDTFNSIENEDNRFIVTEKSPDNSEVRLNPLSNETDFINTFSKIKNHKRTSKTLDLNKSSFIQFYREYVNFVFSDNSISNIFLGHDIVIDNKSFFDYIKSIFEKRLNDEAKAHDKAENVIDIMKVLLKSKKGEALGQISKYFEESQNDLFDRLNNTSPENENERNSILNEFKIGMKNEMNLFLNTVIDEIVDQIFVSGDLNSPAYVEPIEDDPGGVGTRDELVYDNNDSNTGGGSTSSSEFEVN